MKATNLTRKKGTCNVLFNTMKITDVPTYGYFTWGGYVFHIHRELKKGPLLNTVTVNPKVWTITEESTGETIITGTDTVKEIVEKGINRLRSHVDSVDRIIEEKLNCPFHGSVYSFSDAFCEE